MQNEKHLASAPTRLVLLFVTLVLALVVAFLIGDRLESDKNTAPDESSAAAVDPGTRVLNINTRNIGLENDYVLLNQEKTLEPGNYRLQTILKQYNLTPNEENVELQILCRQAQCVSNGQTIPYGGSLTGSVITVNGGLPSNGAFETLSTTFDTSAASANQSVNVVLRAEKGAEVDIREISLKNTTTGREKLTNPNFKDFTTPTGVNIKQPTNWFGGTDNFSYNLGLQQSSFPDSEDGNVLIVNSSSRMKLDSAEENQSLPIVRYEQTVNLQALTSYYIDVRAFAPIVKGRGVQVVLACANANGCANYANNEILRTITIPQGTNFASNPRQNFTVPNQNSYYLRIIVQDGSEAVFDSVKILRGSEQPNQPGLGQNGTFATSIDYSLANSRPNGWRGDSMNNANRFSRVGEIRYDVSGSVYCTEGDTKVAMPNVHVKRMKSQQLYRTVGITNSTGNWTAALYNSVLREEPPFTLEVFNDEGDRLYGNNNTCTDKPVSRAVISNVNTLREQNGCRRFIPQDALNINLGSCDSVSTSPIPPGGNIQETKDSEGNTIIRTNPTNELGGSSKQ